MSGVRGAIADRITTWTSQAGMGTQYREPVVGLARADDPRFDDLLSLVPGHLRPSDVLPEARSVCVFFLPFHKSIVASNARGETASAVWARAYVETNTLLADICDRLAGALGREGIRAA